MEALLASNDYKMPTLKRGQEVEGKVISATHTEILVDVGGKSEGIITGRELSASRDIASKLAVGDLVNVNVVYQENDAGQVVLSLRKLSGEKRWEDLAEKQKEGSEVEVLAQEANRGGIICEWFGLRGFLPASQLSKTPSKLEDLVGKYLSVRIIEVDRATNRLIFSQKMPGKKDLGDLIKLLAKVKIGEKFEGIVSAVLPFGIFVEINLDGTKGTRGSKGAKVETSDSSDSSVPSVTSKLEGLVHISEISWEKVDDPGKIFKVGDSVSVVVIAKDTTTGRLNLSIKQLLQDPFVEASKNYSKEQKVRGKISKVTPYGVFVNLSEGVEGLIHISKIPPNVEYNSGQEIDCEIEAVDTASRKISLVPIVTEKPILYR
ncbi:MAG: S1 RNA-binding domain-containing protein [Candidatus Curtissbacteria bacterium]|nr:S1 RNA-binding domain-containing protein [Candidatus Curtissbacteria bacterium]